MKKYIRFGRVPVDGFSINWLSLPFRYHDDVGYKMEHGMTAKQALEDVFKGRDVTRYLERGVSVFETDADELPKIDTYKLLSSLVTRINDDCYSVEGRVIGSGTDEEPVLDVTRVKTITIDKDVLIDKIERVLTANFKEVKKGTSKEPKTDKIYKFYGYGNLRGTKHVLYNGKEYWHPINDWIQ